MEFRPNSHVGVNVPVARLLDEFDAIVLTGGCETPRDLAIPGKELFGIEFAFDYLVPQNRRDEGRPIPNDEAILAQGRDVVVIGGGDTGADGVGTAIRQRARSVVQLERLPKPPAWENKWLTWPHWPLKLRTSTSHEEGCERDWAIGTQAFVGDNGGVTGVQTVRLEWRQEADGRWSMPEIAGSETVLPAERVLLALGFVQPVYEGMLQQLGVALDAQGDVRANTDTYQTSRNDVFVAGDMRRGQSLVVWAIREGRQCARAVDEFLMGGGFVGVGGTGAAGRNHSPDAG